MIVPSSHPKSARFLYGLTRATLSVGNELDTKLKCFPVLLKIEGSMFG